MSWEEQITGEPIKGCTCGTCIWKLMPGGVGKSLRTGCSALWMVEYDPDAVKIKPFTDEDIRASRATLIKLCSIKYTDTLI